jgi:hypothetical protein
MSSQGKDGFLDIEPRFIVACYDPEHLIGIVWRLERRLRREETPKSIFQRVCHAPLPSLNLPIIKYLLS